MIGLVVVIMIFSIPIIAIITDFFEKKAKINREMIKDQLELERLKQENFVIETEKLKLELEKMENQYVNNDLKKL